MNIYRLVSKAPNYIQRFGLFAGVRLLCQIERSLPQRSSVVKRYTVAGQPDRIALRESVVDHAIFWQCLVRNQYNVSDFPHARRLVAAYEEQVRRGIQPLIIDCGANIGFRPRVHFCRRISRICRMDSCSAAIAPLSVSGRTARWTIQRRYPSGTRPRGQGRLFTITDLGVHIALI